MPRSGLSRLARLGLRPRPVGSTKAEEQVNAAPCGYACLRAQARARWNLSDRGDRSFRCPRDCRPTPFLLTFEGAHFVDSTLTGGLRHDGRFTASAPFCSAGRAYDVRHVVVEPLTVLRLHTCDDGSGSFTAFMPVVRGEHGGPGVWQFVEGTGGYAALRGVGTYAGTLTSGNPGAFETISYRTEWRGVVGFDVDPPAIENSRRRCGGFASEFRPTRCESPLWAATRVCRSHTRWTFGLDSSPRPQARFSGVRTSDDHSSDPPFARCPQRPQFCLLRATLSETKRAPRGHSVCGSRPRTSRMTTADARCSSSPDAHEDRR